MLDRLARIVAANPRIVVLTWGLLATVGVAAAVGVFGQLGNRNSVVSGSESQRAASTITRNIPGHAGSEVFAVLTVRNPAPHSLGRYVVHPDAPLALTVIQGMRQRAIRMIERRLTGVQDVRRSRAVATTVVMNRRPRFVEGVTVMSIPLALDSSSAEKRLDAIRSETSAASGRFVSIGIIGGIAFSERYSELAREDLTRAEAVALPLTLTILLIAFLSVIAAALPLLLAVATLLVTFIFLYLLGLQMGLSPFVTNTASVLALGLSVDFSLFMVMRYREELATSPTVEHALRKTMTTTGRAVLLSGTTIAAALLSLSATGITTFTSMAIGASLATSMAVVAALTLLPALLCLLEARIDHLSVGRVTTDARRGRLWPYFARLSTSHPIVVLVACCSLLLVLALPSLSMDLKVSTLSALPERDPVANDVQRVVKAFGQGAGSPVQIVTKQDRSAVSATLNRDAGVERLWEWIDGEHGWLKVQAILKTPPDARASQRTVDRLRRKLGTAARPTYLGGLTATTRDLTARIASRASVVVLVAVLIGTALLAIGLRSILIPIKAMLGTLLSVAAALGIVSLIFGSMEFFVPLLVFAIVFGLSVDYEVFLISRIREYLEEGCTTHDAVSRGLVASGRSITLAALTLATIFGALALAALNGFQQLGVAIAIAVLLDATLVRCMLVPASVAVLGKWNWWLPASWSRVTDVGAQGKRL